jgi:phage terminase small subunit
VGSLRAQASGEDSLGEVGARGVVDKRLTDKQRLFVAEYVKDLNAAAAARRAGYKHSDNGRQLRAKAHVAAAIEKAIQARVERTRVDADKVVRELAKLGFSDWRELGSWSNEGVDLKDSGEITDEAAATVKDVSMTKERRYGRNGDLIETTHTSLKLHDKKGALELLGRHLGIFRDNFNIGTGERPFVVRVKGLPSAARREVGGLHSESGEWTELTQDLELNREFS